MSFAPVSDISIKLILLSAGVKYPQLDDAIEWAFGSLDIPVSAWVETWNHKHRDVFEMKGDKSFFDTVYLVGEAYVKHECGVWRTVESTATSTEPIKISEPCTSHERDTTYEDAKEFEEYQKEQLDEDKRNENKDN